MLIAEAAVQFAAPISGIARHLNTLLSPRRAWAACARTECDDLSMAKLSASFRFRAAAALDTEWSNVFRRAYDWPEHLKIQPSAAVPSRQRQHRHRQ